MEDIFIMHTAEFGRGLYADNDFITNDIICECEILVLSEADTKVVNTTDLQFYTFVYNDKQDCIVLGVGELFNHDDKANVSYFLVNRTDDTTDLTHKVMVFAANRNIDAGEQLFINYNADIRVDAKKYTKNLVG